jgi:hypothetical protein
MTEESELERAIRRVVTRVLAEPISLELLERMKAYGSPEKFLFFGGSIACVKTSRHTPER